MKLITKENKFKAEQTLQKYRYKDNPQSCRDNLLSLTKEVNFIDDLGSKYAIIVEKHDREFDCGALRSVDTSYLEMIYCRAVSANQNAVTINNVNGNERIYHCSPDTILCAL